MRRWFAGPSAPSKRQLGAAPALAIPNYVKYWEYGEAEPDFPSGAC